MNYLMSYRIEQSIPLLVNTSYTITEIALQVVFPGASYYTEIFHRIMGITPSDYRCQIRGDLPGLTVVSSVTFYIPKRSCILTICVVKIHDLFLYAIPGSTSRLSPSAAEVAR